VANLLFYNSVVKGGNRTITLTFAKIRTRSTLFLSHLPGQKFALQFKLAAH